jgi:hypothetical protein
VLKVREFLGRETFLQPNFRDPEKDRIDDRREGGSDVLDERTDGMTIEEDQPEILRELRRRINVGGEESKALVCLVGHRSVMARKPEVKNSE